MSNYFTILINEVGKWSQSNFKDNNGANELAAFAGVVEEFCKEFVEADTEGEREKALDAVADTFIYLADVFYRTRNTNVDLRFDQDYEPSTYYDIIITIGDASHYLLKRRQGIRAVTDEQVSESLSKLFKTLLFYFRDRRGFRVEEIVWRTWNQVKNRDWNKNPDNAHEVAAAGTGEVQQEFEFMRNDS